MNRRDFSFGALIGFAFAGSGMLAGIALKTQKKKPPAQKLVTYRKEITADYVRQNFQPHDTIYDSVVIGRVP